MSFSSFFKWVQGTLKKAFKAAEESGLSDDLVQLALRYVQNAVTKFTDNTDRREWVVRLLMDRKVPESVARIAVELAYQLYKLEVSKVDAPKS